jgi:hypothetical protein
MFVTKPARYTVKKAFRYSRPQPGCHKLSLGGNNLYMTELFPPTESFVSVRRIFLCLKFCLNYCIGSKLILHCFAQLWACKCLIQMWQHIQIGLQKVLNVLYSVGQYICIFFCIAIWLNKSLDQP